MRFETVARGDGAFQRPVTPQQIEDVFRRALGHGTRVLAARELGSGMYNSTFRVEVAGRQRALILRVAPAPRQQFASERELMRNEFASLPHLAVIAPLLAQVVAVDWSHEVVGRDWMVQTLLEGVPAPRRLGGYPRSVWPVFFRRLGEVAVCVHAVRGEAFGPVRGPWYGSWSQAVVASLCTIAADVEAAGLDGDDLRRVAQIASDGAAVLDEVREPRMTLGDLWTQNTMLDATAAEPTLTGVFDTDRTWWADPAADWTIRMAMAKHDERAAFWDGYGPPDRSQGARWRQCVYEARHLGAIRLERHRLGRDDLADTYDRVRAVLAEIGRTA